MNEVVSIFVSRLVRTVSVLNDWAGPKRLKIKGTMFKHTHKLPFITKLFASRWYLACTCIFTTIIVFMRIILSQRFSGYTFPESHGRGGSRIPSRRGRQPARGRQHMILSKFPKNCMKLRKFWAVGPPLHMTQNHKIIFFTKGVSCE